MGKPKKFMRHQIVEVRRMPTGPWERAVYQEQLPLITRRGWHKVKIEGDYVDVPSRRIHRVSLAEFMFRARGGEVN